MKQQLIQEAQRFQKLANIKESQLNESFTLLNAFALAGALTLGRDWLIKKKREIADKEKEKVNAKYAKQYAADRAAEKEAIKAADEALTKAEYQNTLRQIAADPDIKKWAKEADEKHEEAYKEWEERGGGRGGGYYSDPGMAMPPSWGQQGYRENEMDKIKKKIETFERGKELLNILSRSSKFIGSMIPRESLNNKTMNKSIEQAVNEALAKFRKTGK